MQKRLVRKQELEMLLSQIEPHPSPKPSLEQYTIPADVAAVLLYIAAYANESISDKIVLDLGCGTGRLAIGAAFLGAKQVVGIDVDRDAVKQASRNLEKVGLKEKVQWIIGDINAVCGNFDTILQNPPFGVQKRKADRKFLEKALTMGKVIYSLHKSPYKDSTLTKRLKASKGSPMQVASNSFLKNFIERHNGKIRTVYAMIMTIPHIFHFHTKRKHDFIVNLYVIERR